MLTSEFRWPIRVYIEDTDVGGIVYYVNYLRFIERARTEYFRSLGFAKAATFDANLMFVVRSCHIDYFLAAKLDDELQATAQVISSKGAKITFLQRVLRGKEQLCAGEVVIACVDRHTLKPQRVPKLILEALEDV